MDSKGSDLPRGTLCPRQLRYATNYVIPCKGEACCRLSVSLQTKLLAPSRNMRCTLGEFPQLLKLVLGRLLVGTRAKVAIFLTLFVMMTFGSSIGLTHTHNN